MSGAGRKRSFIWTTFTESGDGKVKCNICSKQFKIVNGSTGNMYRHLKTTHPTVKISRSSPLASADRPTTEPISQSVDLNVTNDIAIPSCSSATSMPSCSSVNIVAIETRNTVEPKTAATIPLYNVNATATQFQSSLTSFVSRPLPQSRSKIIDTQLVRMVAKEYQPLTIVEDKEFKQFVSLLNPNYLLPSRKTLTTNLIPQHYKVVSEKVLNELSKADAVALTTDSWTSLANENYLAVTAHFVDEVGCLKTYLLDCLQFNNSHTAENLARELKRVVLEWGLTDKIEAVVSDNAANIKAAVKLCGWRHIPCFAHNINLIVQAGIGKIASIVTKAKSVVEFFKRSPKAYAKLHSTQLQMGTKELKLKQEVPTRWNSCLMMLERILDVKEPLISTLALIKPELNTITECEWEIISEACKLLKIFEEVTTEMSSQKTATLSKVIFLSKSILKHTRTVQETSKNNKIQEMCVTMTEQIKMRFNNVENDSLLLESTLLDPRLKKHGFAGNHDTFKKAYSKLCDKAGNTVVLEEPELEGPASHETIRESTSLAWSDFDSSVKQLLSNDNPTAAGIIEVDKYLNEPLIKRSKNPFSWWEDKRFVYSRLYLLMKKRLCIPASSTPCERVFSKAGQLISERRNRLKSKHVSQLIFLHSNM